MKKIIISFFIFVFSFLIHSYEYNYNTNYLKNINCFNDIEDMKLSFFASEDTSWLNLGIHSVVNTYNPAIKFQTRFVLNDKFRLGIVGNFFNQATFNEVFDDQSGDSNKTQDWSAIKNWLDTYFGWKINSNVHIGFTLGGGSNFDKYYKYTNRQLDNQTTEKIDGCGFVRSGVGVKLNSLLFNESLQYLFIEQTFEGQLLGNGSVGIEKFIFGQSLNRWQTFDDHPLLDSIYYNSQINPTTSYSWSSASGNNSSFKFYGLKEYGKVGISLPLHNLVKELYVFEEFDLKVELEHKISTKFYSTYEYCSTAPPVSPLLAKYTIKSQFDPSGVSLLVGLLFRPVSEIEIDVNYRPNFIFAGTEWTDENSISYKDYLFMIVHEIETTVLIKFPKVVLLSLGINYYITQKIEYQYQTDGNYKREAIGGDALTHSLTQSLKPTLGLGFKIIDKPAAQTVLNIIWDPKVILFDGNIYTESTTQTTLDTNILNLANWRVYLDIKFNPKELTKGK